jgi:hypothetical protein
MFSRARVWVGLNFFRVSNVVVKFSDTILNEVAINVWLFFKGMFWYSSAFCAKH